MIKTYTDDEIANACMKEVDTWDMDRLLQFAYDELYHFYSVQAHSATLDVFMKETNDEV